MGQPSVIEAYSASLGKYGLNKKSVQVMAKTGVDISNHKPKLIDELPVQEFDYVITVCNHAHESCPIFYVRPGSFTRILTIRQGLQQMSLMGKKLLPITVECEIK